MQPPMHRCHAQPSLPVVPDTNPTPPTQGTLRLHDTAAQTTLAFETKLSQKCSLTRTLETRLPPHPY